MSRTDKRRKGIERERERERDREEKEAEQNRYK